jgi:hypothetical protein
MPQHDHSRSDSNHAERPRGGSSRSERRESPRPAHSGNDPLAAADSIRAQIAELRAKSLEAGLRAQTEMFDMFQAVSRDWVTRAKSEAELAFNLPTRLRAADTVPDAISAYQGWLKEWVTMCRRDSRNLLTDGQKIVNTGVRCFNSIVPGQ